MHAKPGSEPAYAQRRWSRGPLAAGIAASLAALALGACGTTAVSTGGYKGESKAVAQRISDFQSDTTAVDEKKVCQNDLASAVKTRLQAAGGACPTALKEQLKQIDSVELEVKSIAVSGDTATAIVSSTWSGKKRPATLKLVKEGSAWKIAAVQ